MNVKTNMKKQTLLNTKNERQSNIELMRIIAMIMIVGCHFASHGGFSFETNSLTIPRVWWHVLYLGGNFGTDVFMMISGYFLFTDETLLPKLSKIVTLWLQIFFYSVLLFFVAIPLGYGDMSLKAIIACILPISFSEWWFASAYFVLYLLHPYINLALKAMNKKEYQRFLILIIIMWSIIPTLTTSSFQKNDLIELFLMYAIAGYIRNYGFFDDLTGLKWGIIWVFTCILTVGSAIFILLIGKNKEIIYSHSTYFYRQTCILTIIRAVSFFMMFLKIKIANRAYINSISSTMFGVYLLHDSKLLRKVLWMDLFKNATFQNTSALIPYSILIVSMVFVCSVLIELCRQFLIDKPIKQILRKKGHC